MICYRDRTYCTFGLLCKHGNTCDRVLTEKIKRDAKKWWGSTGAPIAVYQGYPECFKAFFEEDGE